MDNQNGAYLIHHGILGMKWGVRRNGSTISSSKSVRKVSTGKTSSKKENQQSAVKKMSDAELRQKINRMQMEKQYNQLTKTEISTGKKFVSDILTNAAKQTATNYVSKYMTKGIDTLIEGVTKKN